MEAAIALITLAAMEIVLGIDNIVYLAILSSQLPVNQQAKARQIGLLLALVMRIGLLCGITWVMSLTYPVFHISWGFQTVGLSSAAEWMKDQAEEAQETHRRHEERHHPVTEGEEDQIAAQPPHDDPDGISIKDLILIAGGVFLLYNSVRHIHHSVEGHVEQKAKARSATFSGVLVQIVAFDLIFSLDSVITAVGMSKQIPIMIAAVVIAMVVMMLFANPLSRFVEKNPTITMLALSFLILIGVLLVAEGLGQHLNKGYIYFAMAFSLIVEMLNLRMKANAKKKLGPDHAEHI